MPFAINKQHFAVAVRFIRHRVILANIRHIGLFINFHNVSHCQCLRRRPDKIIRRYPAGLIFVAVEQSHIFHLDSIEKHIRFRIRRALEPTQDNSHHISDSHRNLVVGIKRGVRTNTIIVQFHLNFVSLGTGHNPRFLECVEFHWNSAICRFGCADNTQIGKEWQIGMRETDTVQITKCLF